MSMVTMQEGTPIPDDWSTGTVSDFFNIITGSTPPTKEAEFWNQGTIQWFTPADLSKLNGEIFTKKSERRITQKGLKYSNLETAPKGAIIISTRAPVGTIAIASEPATFNQGCKGLVPKDLQSTDSIFYYYYLLFNRENLNNRSSGSTFKELSKDLLEQFPLPLPPVEEQRRIATILTTVDDAIQRSRRAAAETELLKTGVMQDLLTKGIGHTEFREDPDIGIVPKEWAVKPLDELIEIVDCRHHTPTYIESGYPVVRPQNIKTDGIDFSNCANISRQEYLLMTERHTPKKGDIVYSRNASFGVPAFVETDREFCLGQDMVVMTKLTADTKYVFYVLCSGSIQRQLKQLSGGSTIQRINLKDIRRLLIPEPKLKEQQKISTILSTIDRKLTLQHQRTANYEHLKQGLMHELLTGKRRVAVT